MAAPLRAAVAVAFALLALAATARAEPSASEKETARGLMAEGRARRDRGDSRGALESFRGADAIMHVPTTGLEVARTQVALGRLVEASETLRAVLRIPASPADPAPFVAARGAAQSLLADVAARIPSIRVAMTGPRDATKVTIDDVAIPAEVVGEPFKVDPGHHVVRASQGGPASTREVDVAERETKVVAIDAPPAPAPAGEPVAAPAPVAPEGDVAPPSDEPAEPAARSHTVRTVAWAGVAVAGAGVVAGSITGILSLSHTSAAKGICNGDRCPPAAAADLDAAHSMATISTAAFVVAGAGAAIAVVGFLVGDPEPDVTRAGRVVPWIGPGSVGAHVAF